MLQMKKDLDQRYREGNPVRIALVGTGKMGGALIAQLHSLRGITPSVVVNRTPQRAIDILLRAGYPRERLETSSDFRAQERAVAKGSIVVTNDYRAALRLPIEALVDATGNPSLGAELAMETIRAGKHIIMLNVETDAAVGPELLRLARERGVVYTGSAGDEPGAIVELADFVLGNGFDLLAVGKGKNNPLDRYATAQKVAERAAAQGLRPEMLTSFVDGTNTMIELTSAGNALGFVPDVPGGHGETLTRETIPSFYRTKEEGGSLSRYGIVDFAFGMAPGVYAVATSHSQDVRELLRYVSLGDGPNFAFLRPFHLTSLETPTSIYRAVVRNEATICPEAGQVVDTIAVAKRDIRKGERIGGIGSDDVYGLMVPHERQQAEHLVPIGLITPGTAAAQDIPKDTWIQPAHLTFGEKLPIHLLREAQDAQAPA